MPNEWGIVGTEPVAKVVGDRLPPAYEIMAKEFDQIRNDLIVQRDELERSLYDVKTRICMYAAVLEAAQQDVSSQGATEAF